MEFSSEEEALLKDLVKGSRQRIHQVKWVDRDGTQRLTVLSQADSTKVNDIARRLKLSPAEVLRKAAFIPVAKPAPQAPQTPPLASQD